MPKRRQPTASVRSSRVSQRQFAQRQLPQAPVKTEVSPLNALIAHARATIKFAEALQGVPLSIAKEVVWHFAHKLGAPDVYEGALEATEADVNEALDGVLGPQAEEEPEDEPVEEGAEVEDADETEEEAMSVQALADAEAERRRKLDVKLEYQREYRRRKRVEREAR